MRVKVRHGLSGIFTLVDHEPVSGSESELLGDGFCRIQNCEMVSGVGERSEPRNLLTRHDDDVDRSLRCDVLKRHYMLIFEHDLCRNFAGNDLRKEGRHIFSMEPCQNESHAR